MGTQIRQGFGKLDATNGSWCHEGCFIDNKQHGRGTVRGLNGYYYEGFWEKGLKHGQGREIGDDRTKYEGNFFRGQISGRGKKK